ncbi:MAG: DUF126 domain-containing protein [Ruminococcaceae bacterium]|nr:DUF126 domain-containing protein [Oscillospiraceae bacterium]
MKKFKRRIVTPGTVTAKAVVTKEGFNTLASMQMALQFGDKSVKCGDQNNADIYGKTLAGNALCLPQTIGSTTGGLVLYCACALKTYPACMLFSNHIDPKKSLVFSSSGSFCLILLQARNSDFSF